MQKIKALKIIISVACSNLYIVALCSLELVSLFYISEYLFWEIKEKRNLSSDLVCVTDLSSAQYALHCDLSFSHKMKAGLSLS